MTKLQKALIVENERLIALDIQNKLQKKGFEGYIATNYSESISLGNQHSFDVAIVDIDLHEKQDGIDVVNELQKTNDIPVVYSTAFDDHRLINRVVQSNPYGYIVKPFDEIELVLAVNIAVERFRNKKELDTKNKWITSILNTITDMIVVTNPEGDITFVNHVAKDMFDLDVGTSRNLFELVSFYDQDSHQFDGKINLIDRVVRTQKALIYSGIKIQKNGDLDSKKIDVDCRFSPLNSTSVVKEGVVISMQRIS